MIDWRCRRRSKARVLTWLTVWAGAAAPLASQEPAADTLKVYSLGEALRVALTTSPALREAAGRLHVAEQQVREAWGDVLPNISANASYSRNIEVQQAFLPAFLFDPNAPPDLLTPVRFGSDNTWTAGVSVEQPLFELDVFIGLGAAGRFRGVEEERYRGTAQEVVSAVRQAYFAALLAAEEVRLTTQTIERTRQSLTETQGLNRAGLASDYDVLRLEVQLGNLEPNLLRASQRAAASGRALLVQMGLAPTAAIALEGSLNELDLEDPSQNTPVNARLLALAGSGATAREDAGSLYQAALERRSDLRALRLSVEVREAQLASQRADYFPSLSLFGSYAVTAQQDDPVNFFGASMQRTTFAVAGLRIEVPIFQGFQRSARMQQTRALIDQIDAQLSRLEHRTANDVHTLVDQVAEARRRAVAQRRAVGQAQRGFEIASTEYREGVGSQLQVTDAEVALRQSEFNYAQAVYDYLSALARLDEAVGTVPESLTDLETSEPAPMNEEEGN